MNWLIKIRCSKRTRTAIIMSGINFNVDNGQVFDNKPLREEVELQPAK